MGISGIVESIGGILIIRGVYGYWGNGCRQRRRMKMVVLMLMILMNTSRNALQLP